jgi:hypothetical protein
VSSSSFDLSSPAIAITRPNALLLSPTFVRVFPVFFCLMQKSNVHVPTYEGGAAPRPRPNPPRLKCVSKVEINAGSCSTYNEGANSPGAPPSLPSPASRLRYPPSRSLRSLSPPLPPRPPNGLRSGRSPSPPIIPRGGAWDLCCLMCVAGTISAGRWSHSRR